MSKNYGIGFCREVVRRLETAEDKMIEETGYGYDYFGREIQTIREYKRLLKKFKREKELGLPPSYDPHIHGTFNE